MAPSQYSSARSVQPRRQRPQVWSGLFTLEAQSAARGRCQGPTRVACCAWGPRSLWDQVLQRSSPAALIPGGRCLSMLEAVFLRCRLQRWPLLGLWTQCALGSGQVPWSTLDVCMLEAPGNTPCFAGTLCFHALLVCLGQPTTVSGWMPTPSEWSPVPLCP